MTPLLLSLLCVVGPIVTVVEGAMTPPNVVISSASPRKYWRHPRPPPFEPTDAPHASTPTTPPPSSNVTTTTAPSAMPTVLCPSSVVPMTVAPTDSVAPSTSVMPSSMPSISSMPSSKPSSASSSAAPVVAAVGGTTATPICGPTVAPTATPIDGTTEAPAVAAPIEETTTTTAAPVGAKTVPTPVPTLEDGPRPINVDPNTGTPTPVPATTSAPAEPIATVPELTDAPIVAPTEPPVAEPTDAPVVAPTDAPAPEPTDAPVAAPTEAPVLQPTEAPVVAPTDAPVPEPTEAPIVAPTDAPVPEPTEAPVVAPTDAPTDPPPPPPLPVQSCVLPAPQDVTGDGSLLVSQLIDTQAQTVTVRATSSLGGYIAFGYSEGPGMVSFSGTPNVVVVGQSGGSVQAYTLGGRALPLITPANAAVSNASFTQNGGESVLQFTKPLVEGGQVAVSATGSNQFLWAHSAGGELAYHGTDRGSGSATIETCASARRFLRSG